MKGNCEEKASETNHFIENAEAVAQRCSVKKGVFKNFTKFTGKHLYQRLRLKTIPLLLVEAISYIRRQN